jgi:hypothetical protein
VSLESLNGINFLPLYIWLSLKTNNYIPIGTQMNVNYKENIKKKKASRHQTCSEIFIKYWIK